MNAFVPSAIKQAVLDSLSPRFGEFLSRGCAVSDALPLSAHVVVRFEVDGPSATMLDVDLGGALSFFNIYVRSFFFSLSLYDFITNHNNTNQYKQYRNKHI